MIFGRLWRSFGALGCIEHIKKFLKIASIVAVTNLLCFWISYALLETLWLHFSPLHFLGFVPTPPPSHFAVFILRGFIILGGPSSILLDGISGVYFMPALILCSMLNSFVWGVSLASPIYGVSKRFHHVAAKQIAGAKLI